MKNKNKKRKLSIYKIIGLILLIISIVFGIFISMLDILPTKYFSLLVGILLIINLGVDFFIFRKKVKKYKKRIASGIAIICIIFMIFVFTYLFRTLEFLWGIGNSDYKIENYSVIVLKDSKYEKIEDIKKLDVGYYENTIGAKEANKKLSKEVKVNYQSYNDLDTFPKDLLENKVDALLVEDSILNMLYEDNENFENSIRVIYTFTVKIKADNNAKDVNVVKDSFNVYITGIDTYGDISSVSRSDVNIIMTVNPSTKQVLLTSIPRDYYVQLHGTTGTKDKLTHAGIYGTDMSIKTLEDLLDIEINYYLKVNFSSFIDIINTLNGIEVYSKYSFTSIDGYSYTEGYNKMNGEEALSFARERKAFAEGDRQRGADQQAVIEAIIRKACSKEILSKYNSLLDSIDGEFETNMSQKKITSLIKMQLNDMAEWTVTSISLDGTNGSEFTYTGGNQRLYVMIPDESTVEQASDLIKEVMNGKKLNGSYELKKGNSSNVTKNSDNTSNYSNTNVTNDTQNNISTQIDNNNNNNLEQKQDNNSSVNNDTNIKNSDDKINENIDENIKDDVKDTEVETDSNENSDVTEDNLSTPVETNDENNENENQVVSGNTSNDD